MNDDNYLNKLESITFHRGDSVILNLEFYKPNGTGIDLNMGKIEFRICPYDYYDAPVIIKEAIINHNKKHCCYVILESEDTLKLKHHGKYSYIPVLIDSKEQMYIRGEGNLFIKGYIENGG